MFDESRMFELLQYTKAMPAYRDVPVICVQCLEMGLAEAVLKNMDDAEKSAREAMRLDTRKQFLTSMRLLGVILATKQDYTGAAEQFKAYLAAAPQAQDAATVRNQLSQVEKLLADGK